MKLIKILALILLAFFLSILDTSFFSMIPVFGATIISSYATILYFAVGDELNDFLSFAIAVIFFFSAFSSLPVWLLVSVFLIVPYVIFYLKNNYFSEQSVFSLIVFLGIGEIIFSLSSLIYGQKININGIATVVYFVIINSAFGLAVYYLSRRVKKNFSRKDIKI